MDTAEQPKEPRLRTAFNIFAAVGGIFGLGLELEGSHPYIGIALMFAALAYGVWEVFTSPVAAQRFSRRTRIVFLSVLTVVLLWISWPHIKRIAQKPPAKPTSDLEVTDILMDDLCSAPH
jgi:membrane protein implicated in regulation of membrane protease activity